MPVPVTSKLEIEFTAGSWTDVSLRAGAGVDIVRPRPGVVSPSIPTTLTATLNNAPDASGFCPFTPDNPGSIYYPNVARDKRIRHTVTIGASSYVRFLGWIDKWEPSMGAGGIADTTVTVTASCVQSKYARRKVLSVFGETVLNSPGRDYWPFDDPADSRTVRGLSADPGTWPARDGLVVLPSRTPGSATLQEPDGGHLADGQIEFTRGNDNAPAPVVLLQLRGGSTVRSVSAAYRLSTDPAGLTDDALAAYDQAGNRLWRWCASLSGGTIVWTLFDDLNNAQSFWDTGAPRDDAFHYWHLTFTATTSALYLVDKGGYTKSLGSFAWSYDPRPIGWLVVGGQMIPYRKGKQTNTLQGTVSSLLVQYVSDPGFTYDEFMVPSIASDASRTASFLNTESASTDTLVGGAITPGAGSDLRQVMYTNATKDLLSRWNEHATTVSGQLYTRPDGRREFRRSEDVRPITVSLTLDVAEDLDMPSGGWAQAKEERPTRVIAEGPPGSAEVVDLVAETATGLRLDGPTVQTSAGSVSLLRSVAAAAFGPRGARLAQFGLEVTTMQTDKTAALYALTQGQRVRIDGLPTAYLGLSYIDCYASGWTESYFGNGKLARWVFDTDPADDPPEARLDNDEYGRIAIGDGAATVTGGTCIGNTGTGTIVITSSAPLTTSAGAYPMNLDWLGERITVTAPGGGTSPQTFPVTARGIAPTVARIHTTGQAVDIWHAATLAP